MAELDDKLKKELNAKIKKLYDKAVAKASAKQSFDGGAVKQALIRAQTAVNNGNEAKARSEISTIEKLLG